MNTKKKIERYLRAAPKPSAPEGLLDRLRNDVAVTDAAAHQSLLRRWFAPTGRSVSLWRVAAAAVAIVAALIGIMILTGSGSDRDDVKGERTLAVGNVYAEMMKVRQMAAARDVIGLASMLSEGPFESKLMAANFLAKMGDLPALEVLAMHACGNLVLENQAGKLRLRSANSTDSLEVTGDMLLVYIGQRVHTLTQVRITHDVEGSNEKWKQLQVEFRGLREERVVLEEELAQQMPSLPVDLNELQKRLTRINEILDGLDEAIYVTVDGGRLILDSPFRRRQASAELADGIVRVESHGHIVEASSVTLLLGLRPVRTDGPPLPTPGWRERFDQVYSLDHGEVLRWIRTPFIAERQVYATTEMNYYASNNPPAPDYIFFQWDGRLRWWSIAMHQSSLAGVITDILDTAGLKGYEVKGPDSLRFLPLGGDWIALDDALLEDKLRALETILRDELNVIIRFERDDVEQILWPISEEDD